MRAYLALAAATGIAITPAMVHAERAEPHPAPPLTYAGMTFVFDHVFEEDKNSGVVEAHDEKSNALLWTLTVYEVKHDLRKEMDVQQIYITTAWIENGYLVVKNGRRETYVIDIAKRTVLKRSTTPLERPEKAPRKQTGFTDRRTFPGARGCARAVEREGVVYPESRMTELLSPAEVLEE